jgi:hypothetical protein
MNGISRLATTVAVAGGLGLACLGLGAGVANAGGRYQWCPGDEMGGYGGGFNTPADGRPNWDWGACHSYHYVNYGQGHVSPPSGRAIIPRLHILGRHPICAGPYSFRGPADRR